LVFPSSQTSPPLIFPSPQEGGWQIEFVQTPL
jgi:hypothetical protein